MQTITIQISDEDKAEAIALCAELGQEIADWLAEGIQDALTRQRVRVRNQRAVESALLLMPQPQE